MTIQTQANTAHDIAKQLLSINAIQVRVKPPFTWSSGLPSPIYCDNRKTLAYPEIRKNITQHFVQMIRRHIPLCDCVAGVSTAGIPQGALVAEALQLPFIYVRPKPKEHGMGNQIEGEIKKWKHVVMVEDLLSTGGSSMKAIHALQQQDIHVAGLVAIFTYNFEAAEKLFSDNKIPAYCQSDFFHLLETVGSMNYLSPEELMYVKAWHVDPAHWQV